MSRNDRNTIIEVYALLDHANESYLNLNQVLVHFRYSIVKMSVDAFERNFREYFGLRPYADQTLSSNISICNDSIPVTDELFQLLQSEPFNESQFLKQGYVLLLKKSFILFEGTSKSCLKKISGFRNAVDSFTSSLNRCMCVAGYKCFHVTNSFIHIVPVKKTIVRKTMYKSQPVYSSISFLNKDKYFVNLYLRFEVKLQKHIKRAVVLFCKAINADTNQSKFLQLMSALEISFLNSKSNRPTPQQLAGYVFVLCNDHQNTYETICENFKSLINWKREINDDLSDSPVFVNKIMWIEKILAEVIRKLIRLNHLKPELLIEKLERRLFAITKSRLIHEIK